jgi:hypothetical protein
METNFQFVSITKPGYGWKNQNEHIVRSHVMRQIRRKQRVKREAEQSDLENGPETAKKVDARYGNIWLLVGQVTA